MTYDYDEFYKKWPVDIHDDPARHSFIAGLCRGNVHDVGCGTGTLSDYYTGPYSGQDISNTGIEMAKKTRRADANFGVLDCANAKLLDFSWADTIVMCEFLEHLENDELLFDRIEKTARPGTRIVVSCPNGHELDCDEHVRYFTVPELRKKFERFGRVKFYNWCGAARQIILTCDIGEPVERLVSLVMIVKNEEAGLENAILSALEHVDEIVIGVDRGSKDKTQEIAEKYADVVKFFEWRDDFGAARNYVDEYANGEWRFFLDGHEYLEPCLGFGFVNGTDRDGFMCTIQMETGMMFFNPRIYKKGVKFEGAVHEKQQCKKLGHSEQIRIMHDRAGHQSEEAAKERAVQRNEMMKNIMAKQVQKDKKNTRALYHLAMWAGSEKRYSEAFKWSWKLLRYSQNDQERWFVRFNMALFHLALGHGFRAWWHANQCEEELPGRWETNKLKGVILAQKGDFAGAVEYLIRSQQPNKHLYNQRPWVHDSSGTWNLVGDCFFKMGEYEKAAMSWEGAAHNCKDEGAKDIFAKRAKLMREMAIAQAAASKHLTK